MKHLLLIVALLGAGSRVTHAQTVPALVEQLTALNTLLQTTEKGCRLVENGLKNIGDITHGEFLMHQGYFDSLSLVKPVLISSTLKSKPYVQTIINGRLAFCRGKRYKRPDDRRPGHPACS